jgi:monoamine oxidase
MRRVEADVCVVGAGYAGLTAARRLTQAGLTVAVLEARERVGGRTHTETLPGGGWIDHGGAWFGPGQDRAYALAREVGIETYPTYSAGKTLYVHGGKASAYRGDVPLSIGPLQLLSLGVAMKRLDRMAATLPADASWDAPRAERWDATTLATWIDRNTLPGKGREIIRVVLRDLLTADPAELSLLGMLHLIRGHENLQRLTSIEGGAQQDRVIGGMQAIANRVAAELGDALCLGTPAESISLRGGGVEVGGGDVAVSARRAVVAVPLPLVGRIAFDPPLPVDRAHLAARVPMGAATKIAAVYDEPFWRADGLNALSFDVDGPVSITVDGGALGEQPGIITCIATARHARALSRMDPAARRELVVDALAGRFGPRARQVAAYHETDWGAEEFSRGGYVAHFPPGVLTRYGRALREPVGPVHWAGTETATTGHGSVDGAIRSGERAAEEILYSPKQLRRKSRAARVAAER